MSWPCLKCFQWLPVASSIYESCKVKFQLLPPSLWLYCVWAAYTLSDYFQFQECAMRTFVILHMLFLFTWITLPFLFAWPIPSHSLDFSLDVASFWKASPNSLSSENTLYCYDNTTLFGTCLYPPVSLTNTPQRQELWLACSPLCSQYSAQCLLSGKCSNICWINTWTK